MPKVRAGQEQKTLLVADIVAFTVEIFIRENDCDDDIDVVSLRNATLSSLIHRFVGALASLLVLNVIIF